MKSKRTNKVQSSIWIYWSFEFRSKFGWNSPKSLDLCPILWLKGKNVYLVGGNLPTRCQDSFFQKLNETEDVVEGHEPQIFRKTSDFTREFMTCQFATENSGNPYGIIYASLKIMICFVYKFAINFKLRKTAKVI